MHPVELTYTPSYNTGAHLARALRRNRYTFRQRSKLNVVVFGAMFVGIFVMSAVPVLVRPVVPQLPWYVPLVVTLGGYWALYSLGVAPWIRRESARMIAKASPPEPTVFSATAEGVRWSTATSDILLRWPGIERLFLSEDRLVFMHGPGGAMIELDAFDDEAAFRRFLSEALDQLTAAAQANSRQGALSQYLS